MIDNVRYLRPPRRAWDITVHATHPAAQFATPQEYLRHAPLLVRRSPIKCVVVAALAAAATPLGELLDFDAQAFFDNHIAAALEVGDGVKVQPLVFDHFSAIALSECINVLLMRDGLLAHRGNGDSMDYHLTLPLGLATE